MTRDHLQNALDISGFVPSDSSTFTKGKLLMAILFDMLEQEAMNSIRQNPSEFARLKSEALNI